ncbi:MAG: tetratricopeptide repeat protein [Candidatus Coatesbacteria bacterium]|nr:MAG: tetratricopeptide repeat protein [Candidatus Coatesbacteria bacterium]
MLNRARRNFGGCGFRVAALCAALILCTARNAGGGEEQDYAAALGMYERELYKVSYQYFQDFIAEYPEGRYADRAQFYLGESLRELGSYPEAVHEYRRLTADYPESVCVGKALLKTGDCFLALDNFEQAKKYYRKTVARASDRGDAAEAYLRLGEAFFAEGDFAGAANVYNDTLAEFPEHPDKQLIEYRLGLNHYLNGDRETALKYLEGVKSSPSAGPAATYATAIIFLGEGRYHEALEELQRLQSETEDTVFYNDAVEYHTALAYTGAKDYGVAAEITRCIIAKAPENIPRERLYYVLGYNLFNAGSWEEARAALGETINEAPGGELAVDASFLISLSYLEENRLENARDGFSALASSGQPRSAEANYWLGWIEYEERDYAGAARYFGEAVDDPDAGATGPTAAYWEGYCERKRGDAATAEKIFVALAKEHPENELADDALLKAAEIAFGGGRNEAGRSRLTELITSYPESMYVEKATYLIAHSYAAQIDRGPAVAKLSEFLKTHPESEFAPNATYDIGTVLFADGDYASASGWFERVGVLYPGSALADDAMYQLGQCRFNEGEYERAVETYESLVKYYPGSPRVDEARYQIELCKYKQGEYNSKIEAAEAYVTKYPKSRLNKELYLLLGQSYYRKGTYNRSLDYLGRIDDTDTASFVTARNLMYEIYRRRGKSEEATGVLRSIVDSRAPKNDRADALLKLAKLYESAGDVNRAIGAYGEFAEMFPDDERVPETLLAAGSAMRDSKMYTESNVILLELINKYPAAEETEIAELYAAFNYQRLGDYENAIEFHKRVIDHGRRSLAVQSYYWLGVCELDLGNKDAAVGYFNKIIANYRDFPKWVRKAEAEIAKM